MRTFQIQLSALMGLFLSACLSGTHFYTPPAAYEIVNSKTIPMNREDTWKALVSGISKSFFVINNLDKDSWFANLSFSTDPEKYVDGGMLHNTVKEFWKTTIREISLAQSSDFYRFYKEGFPYPIRNVFRDVALDGIANILIEEIDANSSRLSVNVNYRVSTFLDMSYQAYDFVRKMYYKVDDTQEDTATFNTGGTGRLKKGQGEFTSTGRLEQELLDLVQ